MEDNFTLFSPRSAAHSRALHSSIYSSRFNGFIDLFGSLICFHNSVLCSTTKRDACAYLGQGGKASNEGKSMHIYVPPHG